MRCRAEVGGGRCGIVKDVCPDERTESTESRSVHSKNVLERILSDYCDIVTKL